MLRILEWSGADIEGLGDAWGLSRVVTEVDDDGFVIRELGFDSQGHVVHRYPGELTRAKYGVFDLAKIVPANRGDIDPEEFERMWLA